MKNNSGIYKIINLVNNKIYIGSAIDFTTRKSTHFRDLRKFKHSNNILQRAYNKYGKNNFVFEIIEFCGKEDLIIREQFYMDTLKPEYNICETAGSKKGMKNSDYQKRRVSEANTGLIRTESTKEKISKSKKGKKMSTEHRNKLKLCKNASKKIYCIQTKETFNSVTEASIKFGCCKSAISNILTNRAKKLKHKYEFIYLKNKEELIASL